MTFSRQLLYAASLACLSGVLAHAQTTSSTTTRSFTSPPIGLASSETVQLNVVNTASASTSTGTAAACTGTLSFVNAAGTVIGTATSFTIATGQIFSANLPFSRAGATGVRTEVRGVITLTESTTSRTPCNLVSSIETYDSTSGATHVYRSDEIGGGGGPGRFN